MMPLKRIFHFLGSVQFAISLIITAAFVVVVGTFLESQTESHLLAARWTYEHPLFQLLLSFFFINILFSALRRWPFKKKHIPFLITHLGLLMIIAGTIIKNRFGLQGQMSIWEGSGSQQVLQPHTFALHVEEKSTSLNHNTVSLLPLTSFEPRIYFPYHFPKLKCKLIGYAPHVKDKLETWIKEDKAYFSGVPPIPVEHWEISSPFPKGSTHLKARAGNLQPIKVTALSTTHVREGLEQAYLQDLTLTINLKTGKEEPLKIALQEAVSAPFLYGDGVMSANLHFSSPPDDIAFLQLHWKHKQNNGYEKISIPLQGSEALLIKGNSSYLNSSRFTVDLSRPCLSLSFLEGTDQTTTLLACDCYGRFHAEVFHPDELKTIISYDQGFGGCSVQAVIPFPSFPSGREVKERAAAYECLQQIKRALSESPPLSPPLRLLEHSCRLAQVDFAEAFVQFLLEWHAAAGLNFISNKPFPKSFDLAIKHMDWTLVPKRDQQAIVWVNELFQRLEIELDSGEPIENILAKHHWPLLSEIEKYLKDPKEQSLLNVLAEEIYNLVPYLPELEFSTNDQTSLLAAYFRIYGIDHQLLFQTTKGSQERFEALEEFWKAHSSSTEMVLEKQFLLETLLTHRVIPETAPLKLEECRPGIVLEFQQGQEKQIAAFAYDPQGTGIKWPILNGKFTIRFQPNLQELPYRIRLRQARQIFYPESTQVYSYESDVLISEKGQLPSAHTLSMNHVYETWDGYRFYLAGIGASSDTSLKRIQLAVNHDPAKYFLTYPGAILVFTGIVLLFWILPYRKK